MTARSLSLLALAIAAAATATHTLAAAAPSPRRLPNGQHGKPTTARTLVLPAGAAQRRFTLREPAGVMLLTRITVPHGVHAYVDAIIPHVGGTRFSTALARRDPALSCRRVGADDVCTQSQEWCPMPAGRWRMHLVKTSGPAGPIRVDFVLGPPSRKA